MENVFAKIKRSKASGIAKKVLSSKFFPFTTAAVLLLCYYLGWDIVAIYYIGIVSLLMLLLLDDITPVISQFIFINLVTSLKNTPESSVEGPAYYAQTAILAQIIVIALLVIAALVYRLVMCCVKKQFRLTPVFYGICALSLAFLANGIGSEYYTPKNLLFGCIMSALILGLYTVIKDNIVTDKNFFEKIAYGFIALSVLLLIELTVAYATYENLFVDGVINRGSLFFGWGGYNHYGLLIVMCLPSAVYLAGRSKYGYLFTVYSLLIFAASVLCCSRQAIVVALAVFPVCLITLLIKGKYRIHNIIIVSLAAVAGIVLICIYREEFVKSVQAVFDNFIVDGELNGSGRWKLWKEAINFFERYPVFGAGFYIDYDYGMSAMFLPPTCHNTILEIMSTCGFVGLAAYLCHRVQTVICFLKNITIDRAFIALTISVLLLMSLLDMHIFNIFPTIIYACLLSALEKSAGITETEEILPLVKRNKFRFII